MDGKNGKKEEIEENFKEYYKAYLKSLPKWVWGFTFLGIAYAIICYLYLYPLLLGT